MALWNDSDDGLWQNISVQSIMHRVDGYVVLNVSFIVSNTWTFEGQITIFPREKYNRLVQVTKYFDTVDFGMSNLQESILVVKPCLN